MPRIRRTFVLACSALLIGTASAAAQPGELDRSFDGDGKQTTSFGPPSANRDRASAVVVQPDGKTVVAGTTGSATAEGYADDDFAVVRYEVDGRLDTAFGSGGRVTTDFAGNRDEAGDLVLQPDGALVVVGSAISGDGRNLALARYLPDGRLDTSFGDDGRVLSDLAGGATAASLLADGRIVTAGTTRGSELFAVARVQADGRLDATFAGDGVAVQGGAGCCIESYTGRGLAVRADGSVLVAGGACAKAKGVCDSQLFQFTADGVEDPNFQVAGPARAGIADLAVLPSGKLLFGGGADGLDIARLSSDGQVDTTFACTGAAFGEPLFSPGSLAVQADGGILLAGTIGPFEMPLKRDIGLMRYAATGAPDAAFGSGRPVAADFGGDDLGEAVATAPDGSIVVAGTTRTGIVSAFAVARYQGGPVARRPLDCTPPRVRVTGVPRLGCARRSFTVRIDIKAASIVRSVAVRLNQRLLRRRQRNIVEQRVAVGDLLPGRHFISVVAFDRMGNEGSTSVPFRICRRPAT